MHFRAAEGRQDISMRRQGTIFLIDRDASLRRSEFFASGRFKKVVKPNIKVDVRSFRHQ